MTTYTDGTATIKEKEFLQVDAVEVVDDAVAAKMVKAIAADNIIELSEEEFARNAAKRCNDTDFERLVRDGTGHDINTTDSVLPGGSKRASRVKEELGDEPLTGIEHRLVYRFIKRAFDIVFSAVVLIVFCWLYAIVAIAIKIEDPKGPVIFKQKRVGKDGKEFNMYKFRSMCADAEEKLVDLQELNEKTGPVFKIADDPRIDSRIIETNAKRPLSALAFTSVFPPKTTGLPAAFPQVDVRISSLRNLLENSSRIFLANVGANPSLSKKLAICPIAQIAGSGRLGSSCVAAALQAV